MKFTTNGLASVFHMARLIGLLTDGKHSPFAVEVNNNSSDSTWVYSDYCYEPECAYWSAVTSVVRKLRGSCFIPSRCMNCWKVNVTPQSVDQLFLLLDIQDKYGLTGKCGIDTRELNEAIYSGYYYCKTLGESLILYKMLSALVLNSIGDIPITIKRGCAPIEQEYGEDWIQAEPELEQYVLNNVELICHESCQTEETKQAVKAGWLEFTTKEVINPVQFKDYSKECV